jgi:hypothetical protein
LLAGDEVGAAEFCSGIRGARSLAKSGKQKADQDEENGECVVDGWIE